MKALVTGGGGFLGLAIVKQLLEAGVEVRSLSRSAYSSLDELGVESFRGDLARYEDVLPAVQGCDIVYHTAALAAAWGATKDFYNTNVVGTENIIRACRESGVKKLVYTSSPSATFSGEDQNGVDESYPLPEKFYADYPRTKAQAEIIALAANDESLAVVALRPHAIWGPGDNNPLFKILVGKANAGELKIVGDGKNLIDTIYVEDAARGHLQAGEALDIGSKVSGRAYYLSQDDPRPFGEVLNQMLKAADAPLVDTFVNFKVAYGVGWLLEKIYRLFRLKGEPRITRFQALTFSRAHWYDISAAKRDFGYNPQITIEDGMENLRLSLIK